MDVPTTGICELTLETRDLAVMERFYVEVIGFPVLARETDRVWLACGDRARLGLWLPGEKEFGDEGGRHVHYAYAATAEGLDSIAERLQAARIGYRGPVTHEGGDRSLYVEDPMGNVVEFWDYFEDGDGADEGVAGLES